MAATTKATFEILLNHDGGLFCDKPAIIITMPNGFKKEFQTVEDMSIFFKKEIELWRQREHKLQKIVKLAQDIVTARDEFKEIVGKQVT